MIQTSTIEFLVEETGELLDITGGQVQLTFFDSVFGGSTAKIQVINGRWQIWDFLLKNEESVVKVRWGLVEEGRKTWADWHRMVFPKGKIRYYLEGCDALFHGIDAAWWALTESYREKVYRKRTPSEIVEDILSFHGLQGDVSGTFGKYDFYQANRSDASFIMEELLPLARQAVEERYDCLFFTKNGDTVVFRPPNLKSDALPLLFLPVNKKAQDRGFEFVDLSFNRMDLSNQGWSTSYRWMDPTTKRARSLVANDESVSYPKLEGKVPDISGVNSIVSLVEVDHQASLSKAKSLWSSKFRNRFQLRIRTTARIDVVPDIVVDLKMNDAYNQPYMIGGKYYVTGVKQQIVKGEMTTIMYLERRTLR